MALPLSILFYILRLYKEIFLHKLIGMSSIYKYISKDKILSIHDYSGPNIVYQNENVKFRTDLSSEFNFQTPVGVINSKAISITNKQLSFLPDRLNHYLGDEYGNMLKYTYECILKENVPILIEDPVFQFFDYESVSGTGHSYDLMFYLLYIYKQNNLNCKLLVVNSNNTYYNTTLALIKKYYNVDFIYIDLGKTYIFKTFLCVQNYQNVFFHEVKAFINKTLIIPIINFYDSQCVPYYKNIYKFKVKSPNNTLRFNDTHDITDRMKIYFEENLYINLDTVDEEYRIYLLNKANNIVLSWGSIFYINVDYYILDTTNKFFTLIFCSKILSEKNFLHIDNNEITHVLPSWATSEYYRDQVYTTLKFKGKILCMDTVTHL